MRLAGLSLSQAAKKVVGELKAVDGDGGVIALDDRGNGGSMAFSMRLRGVGTRREKG
jgi:isoaspartyl peptidase/L-asparaginase-like protein (Ntn-hydrolase superfamily)